MYCHTLFQATSCIVVYPNLLNIMSKYISYLKFAFVFVIYIIN